MSKMNELMVVSDEEKAKVRQTYNKTEGDLKTDIAILKEWLQQQPHLPHDEEDCRLERIFLRNKCRIEQTKWKLESCYTLKEIYPDVFEFYDFYSPIIQQARESMIMVPLPKMTGKQERIIFFKITNPELIVGRNCFLYALLMLEICLSFDYCVGEHFVGDFSGFTFSSMKTFEPVIIHKYFKVHREALSGRYLHILYANVPNYMDIFMKGIKAVTKPKFYAKFKTSTNFEPVYDVLPRELMPIEYGGKQRSIYELHEEWGKELPRHVESLKKHSERKSNESLRIGELYNHEFYGTDGTFKKINLD